MEEPKSAVAYRMESERSFDITSEHSDRRARARTLVVLRNCLFGKKRYQSLILNSSLNNLFNALRVAQILNTKVPDLAMVIRFVPFIIIEMLENNQAKDIVRRRVEIKLTTKPSEEDKQQPGFNPGLPKDKIEDPITNVVPRRQYNKDQRPRQGGHGGQKGQKRGEQQQRRNNYRANRQDELSDEQDERRHNNRRPQGRERGADRGGERGGDRDRERERDRGEVRPTVKKSRGGAKGVSTGQREQTEHNYNRSHLNN